MRIEADNTDSAILAELGRRLARARLDRNLSQQHLAHEAGVSKDTVERMEAGGATRLPSLIRVLRVLGLLDQLNVLVPEPLPSPLEQVKLHGKQRQRARRSNTDQERKKTWVWGDEQADGES
ncbi:MAG: helix-turn-helix domain-containing protein [Thermoleophilaceae bacterium]|nr:helix-turn-helix domain-containing protein [Thermoleophilaceae bacterium]